MKLKFQSPTGMHDILSEEQKYFKKIHDAVEEVAEFYGFKRIETPILEETDLFSRGIGLSTDVVKKQMFSFRTKGGDHLTMRPEGTASVIRAYLQNGMQSLPRPIKLWYFGPFFRYEKPQAGRFRQFWQFGLESIGEEGAVRDAEIVQVLYAILKKLRLKNIAIEVNSIGSKCCRPYYRKILVNYFKSRSSSLCANCQRRIKENPLRILDCKEEKCQRIVLQAPQTMDHLCRDCHQDFKEFLEFLDELELPYSLNPHLVRGLDYYGKSVFEIFSSSENKEEGQEEGSPALSKNALGGGGRYDGLAELLSTKKENDTPSTGAAMGIERIIGAMKKDKIKPSHKAKPQIFLAQLGGLAKRKTLKLMEEFRKARIPVLESLGRDSLRAQLSAADKAGAKYTLILGQKEALKGRIIIRYMSTGKQKEVDMEKIVKEMKKLCK